MDNELFSLEEEKTASAGGLDDLEFLIPEEVITVVGVGGAGGNAMNTIIASGDEKVANVRFVAANTDVAALKLSKAPTRLILGRNLTKGRGAGADPNRGCEAAKESEQEISDKLTGSDMIFITCGLGGGTGTGAAPVIAEIGKEKLGALVVAIVTLPFSWEGKNRADKAAAGLEELRGKVDALITIPNDKIIELSDKSTTCVEGFKMSDEVLRQAVTGVSGVIRTVMNINVDFADVRAVLQKSGTAIMGVAEADGDECVFKATQAAMNSPMMTLPMTGASAVLYCIEAGDKVSMQEIAKASQLIEASAGKDANIIWGQNTDAALGTKARVTLIATGLKEVPLGTAQGRGEETAGFVYEKQDLIPSDVVSADSHNMFEGLTGMDIPAYQRKRRQK